MSEMMRVNTRVSKETNDWLDEKSRQSGVSKSALINFAVESYIEQKEVLSRMTDMNQLVQAIERLEKKIEGGNLAD